MELVTIIVIIFSSVVITLFAVLLYRKLSKSSYDKDENIAILESIRESLEKKMYSINDRLVLNEERWRDVNHLLLTKEYLDSSFPVGESRKIHYSDFLKANGISENELNIDNRLIFVLTPFNGIFYDEFMIIRDTCQDLGFKCIRGDEKEFKGDIFPEMLKYIARARIIIANINGRNPNVLYELGVAQAMDKSVILISKEPKELPIDIQSQRFLIYSDSDSLKRSLKGELAKFM